MELHILTFIEQCSGLQGRRRCLAAGVLDIWHATDPPDLGTARHGTSLEYGSQAGKSYYTIFNIFQNLECTRYAIMMALNKHINASRLFDCISVSVNS